MNDILHKGLVRIIHESSFLSPAQYEQLLRLQVHESRSAALEGTHIIRIMNN